MLRMHGEPVVDSGFREGHAPCTLPGNSVGARSGGKTMTRWILAALLAGATGAVQAEGVLSCAEVDELGESLTAVGVALEDDDAEIGEGSPEDQALADISVSVAHIADAAGHEDLGNAGVAMAEAWAANDRDAFTDALAEVVAHLAVASAEAGCD
jgi:hypothetical protein